MTRTEIGPIYSPGFAKIIFDNKNYGVIIIRAKGRTDEDNRVHTEDQEDL